MTFAEKTFWTQEHELQDHYELCLFENVKPYFSNALLGDAFISNGITQNHIVATVSPDNSGCA